MSESGVFKGEEGRRRVLEAYESILGRWPLPLERLELPTSGGATAALVFGPAEGGGDGRNANRPPLVLLHGTGSNSSMWFADAAVLARGRRVYALDIPGEPGLSAESRLDWQGCGAAAWLCEALAALGLGGEGGGRFALLGLSIGGWIALSYAIGRPSSLAALALLCPSGIGRTRPSFTAKAILAGLRGRRGVAALSRSLYGAEEPSEEALRYGMLMAEATAPRMETPRLFSDAELAGIAAPVFLAVGSRDALLRSRESAARLGGALPGAEVLFLEGKGHVLAGLGAEVAAFLDRV